VGGERVSLGHLTHKGMRREGNEDAYIALLPPSAPPGVDAVLAVADGMGGHQAGEVASALAVQIVSSELASSIASSPLSGEKDPGATVQGFLRDAVQEANREITQQSQGDRQGMGTTFTAAVVMKDQAHIAHVGDSRAYLLRAGVITPITKDHSWIADEVRAGRIEAQEAATHPRRNLLTRALGAEPSVDVDTDTVALQPGDVLILASDGLHGVVDDAAIASAVSSAPDPQTACVTLVDQANAGGGPDNITVLIAKVDPEAPSSGDSDETGSGADDESSKSTVVPGDREAQTLVPVGSQPRWWARRVNTISLIAIITGALIAGVVAVVLGLSLFN
jgi:protein phosphatase